MSVDLWTSYVNPDRLTYLSTVHACIIIPSIMQTFTDGVGVDNCKNELLGEDDLDAEKYALTVFGPSEYCACGINKNKR